MKVATFRVYKYTFLINIIGTIFLLAFIVLLQTLKLYLSHKQTIIIIRRRA
ncbi:hypothetical protein NF27_AZ00040 [Candidatus Jidaibacter acanthamoeba]|uniref:Uncharacterized protein n=1 Tax=Candidatus Jidaibacter acanthamoebae TaxID=86105 RepID=A0A0C1QL56_9RICK|nr:hypothetical protein NF27_AZ00040 [Candidatus Jidaibacter acanthamoeba]